MTLFNHPFLKILLILIVVSGSMFLAMHFWQPVHTAPIIFKQTHADTPAPLFVHAPDGSVQTIMQEKMNADKSITYSFFTASVPDDGTRKLLYTKTVIPPVTMTIPLDSWSPDDKYLFLQENDNRTVNSFVFRASGEPFSNGQQFLHVMQLFEKQITNYAFDTVTGWDSPTLMHIFTTQKDNTPGPSFWLDVTSNRFIQLANR